MVALRKNLSIEKGHDVLFGDIRYFFFVTNDRTMTVDEVVHEGRARCNQENLISHRGTQLAARTRGEGVKRRRRDTTTLDTLLRSTHTYAPIWRVLNHIGFWRNERWHRTISLLA